LGCGTLNERSGEIEIIIEREIPIQLSERKDVKPASRRGRNPVLALRAVIIIGD
jgi:hypothetical protein